MDLKIIKENGLALFGLFISIAFILSTMIFSQTLKKIIPSNQIVKVRGVAERVIKADRVNWKIEISVKELELAKAYQRVDGALIHLKKYLHKNGIIDEHITVSGHSQRMATRHMVVDKFKNSIQKFDGYYVSVNIQINNYHNLDLVEKLKKKIGSDLQRDGWPIEAYSPYYYYSKKVSDIKPELLKAASQNAYQRATIVAESSGSSLGGLKAARQGAFNGFDGDGHVGGLAREQTVSAVVTVDYSIDR